MYGCHVLALAALKQFALLEYHIVLYLVASTAMLSVAGSCSLLFLKTNAGSLIQSSVVALLLLFIHLGPILPPISGVSAWVVSFFRV
eukprot:6187784-Pleurochrysis_carterae.AAC.2